MALKSKFVQISKDILNIRANTEPTKAEDEDGAIHGFIENRTEQSSVTHLLVNSSRIVIGHRYRNI